MGHLIAASNYAIFACTSISDFITLISVLLYREIWNTIHKIMVYEIVAIVAIVAIVKIVAIHCKYLDDNYVM